MQSDLDLVRVYWPEELRPAFDALMAIDGALADVVTSSTEPALGAIRLAWWREALERLDHGDPPPEPRLQAVAEHLLPLGVSGAQLSELEDGYATLVEEEADWERVAKAGEKMAEIASTLLGANDAKLNDAGRLIAFGRLARLGHQSPAGEVLNNLTNHRFPKALRPFTTLARLAARDIRNGQEVEPQATPARAVALLSHRLFGMVA